MATLGLRRPIHPKWPAHGQRSALYDAAITAWSLKREFQEPAIRKKPAYHGLGLPLVPGVIELQNSTVRVRNEVDEWVECGSWSPAQPANFITPAFPAFVSGHSTLSRAAAEVLTALTGSAFFPGGFHFAKGSSGQFLQWAEIWVMTWGFKRCRKSPLFIQN